MKLPKSFRPDKNLEKKTNKLLEGIIEKKEVEFSDADPTKRYRVWYRDLLPKDFSLCDYPQDKIAEALIEFKNTKGRDFYIRYFSAFRVADNDIPWTPETVIKTSSFNVRLWHKPKSRFYDKLVDKYTFNKFLKDFTIYTDNKPMKTPYLIAYPHGGCESLYIEKWEHLTVNTLNILLNCIEHDYKDVILKNIKFRDLDIDDIRNSKVPNPKSVNTWFLTPYSAKK